MADIELPQLGESVTEGTITRWFKDIGDQVAEDEPLFEVSTDKVDSEVPSPVAGYLTEILVPEGETVDVGTKLAVLSDSADEAGDDAGGAQDAPAAEQAPPEAEQPPADQAQQTQQEEQPAEAQVTSDPAQTSAPPEPPGSPQVAQPSESSQPAQPAQAPEPAAASASQGTLLSPVVRKLVDDAGIDPGDITGTGVGGRITRADVEDHIRSQGGSAPSAPAAGPSRPAPSRPAPSGPAAAPAAAAPARSAPTTSVSATPGTDTSVPLNKIRQITADHMVQSLSVSAHAYVSTEVDFEAVERVRRANKDQFKVDEGVSLTYLPFVSRALVDALADYPLVNASMGEGAKQLVVHGSVNLGFAVDLDHEGLIVPVIHDAQDQRLRAIARNVVDLANRAKSKKLTADDITGGTVTVTNVGSTGNAFLLPVINQPQVMILSTDGVRRRPVVVTDDTGAESIAIHSVGNLTLGWDHRAFDGAYAAQFLERVKEILETRDWTTEL